MWLGQEGEMKVAIPDSLFNIVIRENPNILGNVVTIAFLIPNILPKEQKKPEEYITTIDRIEKLTGLDFLTSLGRSQDVIEKTPGFLAE